MTLEDLKIIYDTEHAQAGDTELDFYYWAIDYLLSLKNKNVQIKQEIKRHIIGIEKAVEKMEKE